MTDHLPPLYAFRAAGSSLALFHDRAARNFALTLYHPAPSLDVVEHERVEYAVVVTEERLWSKV